MEWPAHLPLEGGGGVSKPHFCVLHIFETFFFLENTFLVFFMFSKIDFKNINQIGPRFLIFENGREQSA